MTEPKRFKDEEELSDMLGSAENAANAPLKEKKGVLARFRSFLSARKEPKTVKKPPDSAPAEMSPGDLKKLNEFLGSIETQLDRVDEQNKSLLAQLSVLKANNETLIG